MKQTSCGVLNYYIKDGKVYVLLAKSGGPYFKNKDIWSIPKGLMEDNESEFNTAVREFREETGIDFDENKVKFLDKKAQSGAKIVSCFYIDGEFDLSNFSSNTFTMEWPPRSGKIQEFPETDEIKYIEIEDAKNIIIKGQVQFLDKLLEELSLN